MSAPKHTPGPWVAIAPKVKGAAYRIETHPECEVTLAFVESGPDNARLIAAAPEMYEALAELTEASAACCRVIAAMGDKAINALEAELIASGVKMGFGARASDVLIKVQA